MTTTARDSGSRCRSASSTRSRSTIAEAKSTTDGTVDRGQFDLDRPVPATAHDVDAGMDDEPAKPGVEPFRVAKRRQGPPGADESILDTVARELRVPEDQPGRRVQPRDGVAGKRREGVMIALLRPLDEVSLVHDSPRSRRGHPVAL